MRCNWLPPPTWLVEEVGDEMQLNRERQQPDDFRRKAETAKLVKIMLYAGENLSSLSLRSVSLWKIVDELNVLAVSTA